MFDKNKKYKVIAAAALIIVCILFLLTNIKVRSVQSYNEEHRNNGYIAVTESSADTLPAMAKETNEHLETEKSEKNTETTANIFTEDITKYLATDAAEATSNDLTTSPSTAPSAAKENVETPNQSAESKTSEQTQPDSASLEPTTQIEYITCTLEIRCDKAVEVKDSIQNEGVKNAIPSDGTIIAKSTYKVPKGEKVYDFLIQVCAKKHIPVAANNGYVASINNLSEKATSAGSGWLYKVNSTSPNISSAAYTLNEGDYVLWYYVNDYREG